ncbi:amidohydrolase [Pseudomonas sp. G2-4]|uniref:amidohydrolase n=1 Tax=Pseudomonas sp. G2-4 TaxID=1506334 RepID=UPI0024B9097A|nr:amidohydrolase [Pseudomonas sp. G2-4]WHS57653.1 amidohydrolase [Pseudomonas sp. G2-4]
MNALKNYCYLLSTIISLLLLSESGLAQDSDVADIILHHGVVEVVDDSFSVADAVAIRGNKIVFVGNNAEVMKFSSATTKIIDLKGAIVFPGINDTHLHALPTGEAMQGLVLRDMSLQQIRAALATAVKTSPPGKLIRGIGWEERSLGRMPTKKDLDDLSPNNPVLLTEMSHHQVLLNTAALKLAGLHENSEDENGVIFLRMEGSHELSGVVVEGYTLINSKVPQPTLEERKSAIKAAISLINSQGVTSYTEPGLTPDEFKAYQALQRDGELNARATIHLWGGSSLEAAGNMLATLPPGLSAKGDGTTEGLLTLRGIKLLLDGVPPAKTAATLDDYACCKGVKGTLTFDGATEGGKAVEIKRTIIGLDKQGYQIAFHSTGDRAARIAVEALISAAQENSTAHPGSALNPLRHYMIHADRVSDEDVVKMGKWQIGLSTNPIISFYAAPTVRKIWGDYYGAKHMAIKPFINSGTLVTLGTDSPVVPTDWKAGLQYAVTRVAIDGQPNGPEYAISIDQALAAHTRVAAYQDHQEDTKGTVEVGKVADLAVFDRDFRTVPSEEIGKVKALLTMVDGRIVYAAPEVVTHRVSSPE